MGKGADPTRALECLCHRLQVRDLHKQLCPCICTLLCMNPLDLVWVTVQEKLAYDDGERDVVLLQQEFIVEGWNPILLI